MDRGYRKIYDADKLFYYFFSEEESCSLIMRIGLQEKVDKRILKKALNQALLRYPNFRQMPVLDAGGHLHTMENDREAEVYPYDPAPANLGTKETGGFLFRVMYEGSTVWVSVFHAVCDGRGYMMFIRTLLYYYFTMAGHPVRNPNNSILTTETPADPSEMADPLEMEMDAEPCPNPFRPTGDENIFMIPQRIKDVDRCSQHGLFRYVLDTEQLLRRAAKARTTVDSYLHLLMARMIHKNYEVGGRLIAGMGAVDLRPFYDNCYLQNNRELFWIYYGESFFRLDDQDAADIIQHQFKEAQLSKERFDGVLALSRESLRETIAFPFAAKEGLRILREHLWSMPELKVSYFTTNLGRLGLGEDMDALVESADIYAPAIFHCPGLMILTQGGRTTVNMVQRGSDRYFPQKLKEAFAQEGLLISSRMGSWFEGDKIRVDKIPCNVEGR